VNKITDMSHTFYGASSFNQQLCWDVAGKIVTEMFTGTNCASIIVCVPSSSPTSQPTQDSSFKKHFKDEVKGVMSYIKDSIFQISSGTRSSIKSFKHAIQPPGYNEDL